MEYPDFGFAIYFLDIDKKEKCLDIEGYENFAYIEVDFGGDHIPKGNEEYILTQVEPEMQETFLLCKKLYSYLQPLYGWLMFRILSQALRSILM